MLDNDRKGNLKFPFSPSLVAYIKRLVYTANSYLKETLQNSKCIEACVF